MKRTYRGMLAKLVVLVAVVVGVAASCLLVAVRDKRLK